MRVSDSLLSANFISNLNSTKSKIQKLQTQIATQTKVAKPSDSPDGTAKILSYNNRLNQSTTYKNNIKNGLSYLDTSISSMETIQNEMVNVMTDLANINNSLENSNLKSYGDKIDMSITQILDAANKSYDGKYVFGGTDYSTATYGYSADGTRIESKVDDNSGSNEIKISSDITAKINISGKELFSTIVKTDGNLDSTSAVGSITNTSTTVNDADGNAYTVNISYQKTAANTYNMSYDVVDGSGTSVFSSAPASKELKFDASSGKLLTVDGQDPKSFSIKVPSKKLDFYLDSESIYEKSSPASITSSKNQDGDIFNTLIKIRDSLRAGIKPTDAQVQMVSDFNNKILDKISSAGDVQNQLNNTNDLLTSEQTTLNSLLSKEQDVDVASAVMTLQSQQSILDISYKVSSMILPKSLLDYL